MSLSAWRAWIEMKYSDVKVAVVEGRSPLGERGLKYEEDIQDDDSPQSLSAWRAWIEM